MNEITQVIINFINGLMGGNTKLVTLFVSMFPLIELKGAIPVGINNGDNLLITFVLAYLGSTIVMIPVFFLLEPIFALLKRVKFLKRFVEKIEGYLKNKAEETAEKEKEKGGNVREEELTDKLKRKILFIFVAIPLPFTGVWTGTAIAVFLKIKFKDSFFAIIVGNLIAGSIIALLTFIFRKYVDLIIGILFILVVIMLLIVFFKVVLFKPKNNKNGED